MEWKFNPYESYTLDVFQLGTGKWERIIDDKTKLQFPKGYDPRFKNGKPIYHFIEKLDNEDFLPRGFNPDGFVMDDI